MQSPTTKWIIEVLFFITAIAMQVLLIAHIYCHLFWELQLHCLFKFKMQIWRDRTIACCSNDGLPCSWLWCWWVVVEMHAQAGGAPQWPRVIQRPNCALSEPRRTHMRTLWLMAPQCLGRSGHGSVWGREMPLLPAPSSRGNKAPVLAPCELVRKWGKVMGGSLGWAACHLLGLGQGVHEFD